MPKKREFESGANRNSSEGKFDYEGFNSALVDHSFAKYMHHHRKLEDGTLRDSDNWQKGFGDNHFDVCMKSAWRHFVDMWKEHRNLSSRDGIDSAICGLLFNVMAYYHKLLMDRKNNGKVLS